jgi:hypothetical protein
MRGMTTGPDPFDESAVDKVIRLQNGIFAHAIGGAFDHGDPEHQKLWLFCRSS